MPTPTFSFCLSSALSLSLLPAFSLSPALFFSLLVTRYTLGVGTEDLSNPCTFKYSSRELQISILGVRGLVAMVELTSCMFFSYNSKGQNLHFDQNIET